MEKKVSVKMLRYYTLQDYHKWLKEERKKDWAELTKIRNRQYRLKKKMEGENDKNKK